MNQFALSFPCYRDMIYLTVVHLLDTNMHYFYHSKNSLSSKNQQCRIEVMESTAKVLIKGAIDKGKRQIHLANEIGISSSSIQKILYTNTKPTVETLRKIAVYFKVPIADLLGNASSAAVVLPMFTVSAEAKSLAEYADKCGPEAIDQAMQILKMFHGKKDANEKRLTVPKKEKAG